MPLRKKKTVHLIDDLLDPYRESDGMQFYVKTKLQNDAIQKSSPAVKTIQQKIHYKVYPRLPRLFLKKDFPKDTLLEALRHRRTLKGRKRVSLSDITYLLASGAGEQSQKPTDSFPHRTYPSAGGRYPVEVYLYSARVPGLSEGIYHYNVRDNALELLTADDFFSTRLKRSFPKKDTKGAAAILILTAVFERNISKYGERGFRHIFFECGHIAQNICLLAARKRIACQPIGAFEEDGLVESLDIFERTELPLYALRLG